MVVPFHGFDFTDFWDEHVYYREEYLEPPPTAAMIGEVESKLGYKLPASYVALMRTRNGGAPNKNSYPTASPTSWADDHVAITAFKGIGQDRVWSLCGSLGSRHLIHEWGYPEIGIYFGDCPSAGHDAIALDYRSCGPLGEPCVIHVDQEIDYRITHPAPDLETFVRGLYTHEYDEDE